VPEEVIDRFVRATGEACEVQLQCTEPIERSQPAEEVVLGAISAILSSCLCSQQVRDIVRKGHERREVKRRECCAPRYISEYVAEMRDAGVDLERGVAALD
jgi:hypothetical protein